MYTLHKISSKNKKNTIKTSLSTMFKKIINMQALQNTLRRSAKTTCSYHHEDERTSKGDRRSHFFILHLSLVSLEEAWWFSSTFTGAALWRALHRGFCADGRTNKLASGRKEAGCSLSLQLHKAVFYIRCPSVFLLAHYKRMYLVKDQINCKMMNKNFKKKCQHRFWFSFHVFTSSGHHEGPLN